MAAEIQKYALRFDSSHGRHASESRDRVAARRQCGQVGWSWLAVLFGGGSGGEEDDGERADPGGGEQREGSLEEAFLGPGCVGALGGDGDQQDGAEEARDDHDGTGWLPFG
jgi:hypothetical protein